MIILAGTSIAVDCQQTQVISDATLETTFHDFKSLVNLYESMSTEKLTNLERSLSETVREVGVIYHQSLCKGLSVLAGDNSDNDSLFCDKVTVFVDEKAKYSQHFIEEMMSECKDDVRETRDSLLGDILYEFNRGVRLTSEEFIRVSRKEIHGYLDDLEDAYISKSDGVAAEFCRKLLERTWADFKQERDSQLCDHSEKRNCTEGVQNIGVKNKYNPSCVTVPEIYKAKQDYRKQNKAILTTTGVSTKDKLKNVWRGFKKFLCCY